MKKVFVALKFGTEGWFEQALRIVHAVEKKLDTYCELIPSIRVPFTYKPENYSPIDTLFSYLNYVRDADVVVFPTDWQSSKELSLLHGIACAYELNIMELDTPSEKTELKPCPFCGGKAEIQPEGLNTSDYWVRCPECGIEQSETSEFAEDAIEVWNRRVCE